MCPTFGKLFGGWMISTWETFRETIIESPEHLKIADEVCLWNYLMVSIIY